ncbi:MAG: Bax inhibitor-1/YccA family protein [Solirubrobacterales bacterium]|jgi:FtsH-binding integral membrane protein
MEYAATPPAIATADTQGFLAKVFGWMFLGLLITGLVAAAIGSSDTLLTDITESPWIMIGLIVVQIGLVITISAAIERLSPAVALGLFFLYAASVGVIFALVFELYTTQSIFTTFLITAAMFGAVGAWGYLTKRDLSTMGTVLLMALVGLILATIVNVFVASEALYWVTTYAGVAIFAGLTAYDMQKIKGYAKAGLEGDAEQRASILGALALYLDFINLFLFLLRIFGRSR